MFIVGGYKQYAVKAVDGAALTFNTDDSLK